MSDSKQMIIERAKNRKQAIKYSMARIQARYEADPDGSKASAYLKRMAEYEVSLKAVELEELTGNKASVSGVFVQVPSGNMMVRGA